MSTISPEQKFIPLNQYPVFITHDEWVQERKNFIQQKKNTFCDRTIKVALVYIHV